MTAFSLGDIVEFHIGLDRYQATIIAYLPGSALGKVIVGWKQGETISPNAWALNYEQLENPQFHSVSNVRNYVRAEWIYESNLKLISRQEQFKVGDKVKVADEECPGTIIVIDGRPEEKDRNLLIAFDKLREYRGFNDMWFLRKVSVFDLTHSANYKSHPQLTNFIGKVVVWAFNKDVSLITSASVIKSEGHACCKCKNFYPFSEPNQPNGTLVCYSCRKYPFYGSIVS